MNPWNRIPFVRILLALLSGILLAINVPSVTKIVWVLPMLLFLVLYIVVGYFDISYRLRFFKGIPLILFFFATGITLVQLNTEINYKEHFSKAVATHYLIKIAETPQVKLNTIKIIGEVVAVKKKPKWQNTTGKILLYISRDKHAEMLNYGDVIICNSKITPTPLPKNPSEFNYKKYLAFHQIYHQTYVSKRNWVNCGVKNSNKILAYSYALRNYFLKTLSDAQINGDAYAIGSALILGYEDRLSPEVIGSFAATGALHVLSVSGLHVGIVFLILTFFLKFLGESKKAKITAFIISILGLWLYALITGLSPSVWRAATMFSLISLGKFYKKDINTINVIGCSAFILLCINPFMITEVGFQLSYLAVIGIVSIHPKLYELFQFKNKIIDQIWTITCVSVAAQLITFPLGLLYFHQFPNYFIFSNLIVIPLSTIILYGGILLLAFAKVPVAGILISKLLLALLWLLKNTVSLFENLPFAITDGISITTIETIAIYGILAGLWLFWNEKKMWYLNLSLMLSICFCGIQIREKLLQKSQEKIIFYAINKHTAIDFVSGTRHAFMADSMLLSNHDKLRFHVIPNRNNLGLSESKNYYLDENNFRQNEILRCNQNYLFYKNQILFRPVSITNKIKALKYQPHIVVLNKKNIYDLKYLALLFPKAKFICDGTVSSNLYQILIQKYPQLSIRSVLNEGAITIEV